MAMATTSTSCSSWVWDHYTKDCTKHVAACSTCGLELSYKGGSTSSLIRHLQHRHELEPPTSTKSKQSSAAKAILLNQLNLKSFGGHEIPSQAVAPTRPYSTRKFRQSTGSTRPCHMSALLYLVQEYSATFLFTTVTSNFHNILVTSIVTHI